MTPEQRSQVLYHLHDGYGTENIAILTGIDLDQVRKEVSRLREAGILKGIYNGRT